MDKKVLITSALPYANGPLHFGHLAGAYLPADILTRHNRLLGKKVIHISGSDEHGVAIMLNANKVKKDYKSYVDEWHAKHKETFSKYKIEFDFFGQTSAKYHEEEVKKWFKNLFDAGMVGTKENQQLFCNDCKNHLPDRFVQGTCYECGYLDARGDECPNCGILIDAPKLKNPVCQMCGSHNIKEVTVSQYYLLLSKYHQQFRNWFSGKSWWKKTVYPYVDSLTKEGLVDRAISRDLDWGIDVPLSEAKGKKLYVWFDAPIGYVSNTKEYLKSINSEEDYIIDWWKNSDTEIINFIGKDNIIFHAIIFPVMSMASGIVNPASNVPANQYLNLAGKQFSKSSGHYVDADKAIEDFGADALRYYLISLIPESSDSSFTWENFQAKVNNELANNIGNLINRCLMFLKKNWSDGIDEKYFAGFATSEYGQSVQKKILEHKALLSDYQIKKAMEVVMTIGHDANNYFSEQAPWAQFKEDKEIAAKTLAYSSQYILILGVMLSPYLPDLSRNILDFFSDCLTVDFQKEIYLGKIEILEKVFANGLMIKTQPKALVPKIEDSIIKSLVEELKGQSF